MAVYFATTDVNSPITLKIEKNKRGQVRSVELIYGNMETFEAWQYLDLLATILPKYLYFANFEVELGTGRGHHPCLVLKQEDTDLKWYRLDKVVSKNWPMLMPVSQLRALVFWWRCNRDQFKEPICEWGIWRNEDA